jgi:predicted CoA-binding protein
VSATDRLAAQLLAGARTIAVVGMSATPGKDAHEVPAALVAAGWRVIPVNPNAAEVLGLPAHPSIAEVGEHIDLVNVFRPAAEAAGIVRQAIAAGAGSVWLQLGIVSPVARRIAEAAGIAYIEDTCIDVVRRRGRITPPLSRATPPAS